MNDCPTMPNLRATRKSSCRTLTFALRTSRSAKRNITRPAKSRLSLLRVLLDGADPRFRLNELAFKLLVQLGVAQKWCKMLSKLLPHEQEWKESQLDEWLDQHLPTLGAKSRKLIKDALAIA